MKFALIIPDGCADEPIPSLGGKTPLEAAHIPHMNAVAAQGIVGRANHVPPEFAPGSDVANLSLFGYSPYDYFTGRAPLEAAAQGIALAREDWAIRCNLVTVQNQVMQSFTAGHISTEEATDLLQAAQHKLGSDTLQFIPGVSYRNLLIFRGSQTKAPFTKDTRATPPHDLTDQSVQDDYPRGPGSDLLCQLMVESGQLFADHPVNAARLAKGLLPATNVWLWGLGQAPALPSFADRFGVRGTMITAVDLLRGLARLAGWTVRDVAGATGYLDTDYAAKGRAAVDALESTDLVCVHVEATDEASHEGRADAKVAALQEIDQKIVGPVHDALKKHGQYRLLVTPDHPTPVRTKTHSHGFVPWAMAGTGIPSGGFTAYNETVAGQSKHCFARGWELMPYFLKS